MAVIASSDVLTTVGAVRSHMSNTDTDPLMTDRMQRYVNAYSRAIRRYTRRQFMPVEAAVAKRFRYDGAGYLSVSPYELQSVSAIKLYTDLPVASQASLASQTATVEAQYRLEPRNGTSENTFLWLALPEIGQYSVLVPEPLVTRRPSGHEVTITGTWGAGVVPADVELACLVAVANALRNPEGFASRSLGALSFTEAPDVMARDESGLSLPRDSRALLHDYRRVAYG